MCLRRRCGASPRSTGTSRASRSPRAGTGSTWWRGSSPRRKGISPIAACWSAKSATVAPRSKGPGRAPSSPGPGTKSSSRAATPSLWLPERPLRLEGGPRRLEGADELALARREPAPQRDPLAARGDFGGQPLGHGHVVQLAQRILKRRQARDERQHGLVRKAAREEVAGIAQPLHADADLMPAALVAPGKLAPLADQARTQSRERLPGEAPEPLRAGGVGFPWIPMQPAQHAQLRLLERGRVRDRRRGLARKSALLPSPREQHRIGVRVGQRLAEHVPVARGAPDLHHPLERSLGGPRARTPQQP